MKKIEARYFELYKTVDAYCRERLESGEPSGKKGEPIYGVSAYIASMESIDPEVRQRFPDWDATYKKLKHLRWIRTEIAHSTEEIECDKTDYDDLAAFYEQLKAGTDILSRAAAAPPPKKAAKPTRPNKTKEPTVPDSPKREKSPLWWLLFLIVVAVILLIRFI